MSVPGFPLGLLRLPSVVLNLSWSGLSFHMDVQSWAKRKKFPEISPFELQTVIVIVVVVVI